VDADWPMIAVRLALYGLLSGLFGLSAFSLYGLRSGERGDALALKPWLVGGGALGLLLSAVALALLAASMAGTPLWPIDGEAIGMLLSGSATGTAWEVRMVALLVATIGAMDAAGRALPLGLVALASGIALATLAWTGHGAMDDGTTGWAHLVADIFHLLAAGAWVGALLGLILLVTRPVSRVDAAHLALTHRALHGFGTVGTIIVATLVATGLINAWLLVGPGNIAALGTTLYGRLLLAKLVLFAAMLGLAALNRFRLTPRFETSLAAKDHRGALGALRRSLAVEVTCIVAILALVAWLGTLEPPAST
jgi:putative copper resistance protein D